MKRREFIRTNLAALGGALLAGGLPASTRAAEPAESRRLSGKPEIKLGMRVSPGLSEQNLEFMRQLGLHWCRLDIYAKDFGYEALARTRDDYEKHGLRIFSVINYARLTPALMLGGPEREAQLQVFARSLGDLGRLGIPVCDMSWIGLLPGSQVFNTSTADLNGIQTRIFDTAEYAKIDHVAGRRWSAEEVRDALKYFLDRILPVAEASGVRISIHPDDPPIAEQGGVARILHTFEQFQQLFALCPSPILGVNFCVGTWTEAGPATGLPVLDMIRWLAAHGRLIDVHFRNIRGVLPRFQETFIDDGDQDMQAVMNTLVDVGFNGLLVPDHVPVFAVDEVPAPPAGAYRTPFPLAGIAYSAACMRTMLRHASQRGPGA